MDGEISVSEGIVGHGGNRNPTQTWLFAVTTNRAIINTVIVIRIDTFTS